MTTTTTRQDAKFVGISITLEQAVKMAIRHYSTIGNLKKARPMINKVIARSKVTFGWKDLVKGFQEIAKKSLDKEKSDILKDWNFSQVLTKAAPLILENKTFGRIAANAIAEGIFSIKEPLKFVQRYSKYTDDKGVIYGKKTTLEEEDGLKVFITRFLPITLTAVNAAKILESAFENFHKMRKNAAIGGKLDICHRVYNGQIYARYEAIKGENGEIIRGKRIK
ncbi:MAG: hypothetical protein IKY94_11705 [Lachnospiraceae bacterium]|nr:hypothetical protein [Lachnospiraceae bacterium]